MSGTGQRHAVAATSEAVAEQLDAEAHPVMDRRSIDYSRYTSGRLLANDEPATGRGTRCGAGMAHGDGISHEFAGDRPQAGGGDRKLTAHARLEAAARRDEIAHARDLAAIARDEAGAARDRELEDSNDPQVLAYLAHAARDREAAVRDRAKAAQDRLHARADREALALALALSETDPLTRARTRAAGLADLDREVERCKRTNVPLVVAYVDVIGLKALNDTRGHAAGDALLRRAVSLIRDHVRPYDLIVRLGGDEFLCAMPNMTLRDARDRFRAISAAMSGPKDPPAIRTGFAELKPGEPAATLIERADDDLVAHGKH